MFVYKDCDVVVVMLGSIL